MTFGSKARLNPDSQLPVTRSSARSVLPSSVLVSASTRCSSLTSARATRNDSLMCLFSGSCRDAAVSSPTLSCANPNWFWALLPFWISRSRLRSR
ncbi:hypothetical protein D3C84_779600 [compost metagenome]